LQPARTSGASRLFDRDRRSEVRQLRRTLSWILTANLGIAYPILGISVGKGCCRMP
jgi:hypothetical protein